MRRLQLAAGALLTLIVACSDTSTPSDNVLALSELRLPLPGVVVNDTMRDSTGAVAPLHVTAFDREGDTVNADISFLAPDRCAHFDGPLMIGDSTALVRVIASSAQLQTLPVTVVVTLSPDTIVPADSTTRQATYSFANVDSIATSTDLTTLVQPLLPLPSGVDAV